MIRSLGGIAVLAAIALGGCSKGESKRTPTTPEAGYVVVKAQSVAVPVVLAGRTAAFEMSEVRPQVSGVIQSRQFAEGSMVSAGQTLYQIDAGIYRATAAEAQASLASAEAARTAAAAKAARYRPLADMEAVSRQDYSDAVAAARQASAGVAQTRAQLDAARINLRYTRVPAPISGRIGRSLVTTGGLVTANQADALTTIQRLDPIFVDIQQSSADLLALRRSLAQGGTSASSTTVRLTLEDGSAYPYAGTLQFAEAMVDPNTGTVTLRARFPNPQALLLPGMYVRAGLSQATLSSAILVPQAGVSRDVQGRATVYVVGPGNKALRKTVTADRTIGDKWLVTAGLKPGERVIVEGLGKIRPNAAIVPVVAGSKPRPRPDGSARS
ncbi:efflux RND transporter periplasmic adaptor subunit [Sphingomonas sp. SUN039]|uniref:efflux RND transporter periplasmic adaptor subunit n=1 Tax=Sphingomonas sp. SUN039 TaxID=2937787 RepID=UPI00216456FB|nr:efflux RND transporter periplasmic adaptor subunit [Sphingomonas sp. SUN039]UVO53138.1 efflux RND transporter periplasmic adaptor subunit [Sphingomonas sp. SUN039]